MKDTFSERLNYALSKRNMNAKTLSELSGIDQSLIHRYLKGLSTPREQKVKTLADCLHVTYEWLIGLDDNNNFFSDKSGVIQIPLYSKLLANKNFFSPSYIIDEIKLDSRYFEVNDNTFAIISKDNHLSELGIYRGDVMIFEKSNVLVDGIIGCFYYKGDTLCRKLALNKDTFALYSNLDNAPIIDSIQELRLLGKLKFSIRRFL